MRFAAELVMTIVKSATLEGDSVEEVRRNPLGCATNLVEQAVLSVESVEIIEEG